MPLPPPPLNVQPLGLLDAFSIKNGGEYPQHLSAQLQPVLDLVKWYDETNGVDYMMTSDGVFATQGNATIGFNSSTPADLPLVGGLVTVPNNEIWKLCDFSITYLIGAGAGSSMDAMPSLRIRQTQGSGFTFRVCPQTAFGALASVAARILGGSVAMIGSTFLKPGDQPQYCVPGFTFGGGGASVTVLGQMRIRRFRI